MSLPLRTIAFWNAYKLLEREPAMQQSAAKVRRASDRRKALLALPPSKVITGRPHRDAQVRDLSMPLPDGTAMPLRVYRPRAATGRLPVVLNFHGGGFVSGDVRQNEWWSSSVAALANVVVVAPEYRLAPESPYPGPVEDCYAATVWVHDHAAELEADAARIAVMGDSAGGNLAAVISMIARDRGGPRIALQLPIYPVVDFVGDYPSELENATAPVLTKKDMDSVPLLYFADPAGQEQEPYASPLLGKHDGLPPALIQTAQFDPLRDQGYAYAAALRAAGIPVRHTNYVSSVHGYMSLPGICPQAGQALAEQVQVIRETFAG